MSDSLILVVLLLAVSILAFIFYPEKGLLNKWRSIKSNNEKILLEDTLKHLFECEYNSTDCTLTSISGFLSTSQGQSSKIIVKLEEMGLVKPIGTKIYLTPEGKSYALKIIRIHRLWEKHLADNTSIREEEWHTLAELEEHKLTDDEVNRLAAKLGNPLKDPHGDPIPSENGEIPEQKGIELADLKEGDIAKIYHIEDQPLKVFSKLTSLGLSPGMIIKLIEKNKNNIRIECEGEEININPILALNVQVVSISDSEELIESHDTLSNIPVDEEVIIVGLSKSLRGQQRRRLLDFGIVPGTVIKARLKSLSGDPTAYEVRGTTVALRKNQSDKIFIKRKNIV
ncbi:MAG: metal-dependent transcriptional regulator [Melioribacter sp.]|nr:metal-dependent transcriptional regulator [Melioribacter sp.]